jgi:hypothetical protein
MELLFDAGSQRILNLNPMTLTNRRIGATILLSGGAHARMDGHRTLMVEVNQ